MTRLALTLLLASTVSCRARGLQPGEGYVQVPGGRVWYRIVGSGTRTPLLVLHGGPGVPSTYLKPLAALADERPVVFYDQLGTGKSDHPTDTTLWRMDRFLDELGRMRAALGLHEIHLYGHSWGGMLAVDYVLSRPTGVRSLMLAGAPIDLPRTLHDDDSLKTTLPDSIAAVLARHERAGSCDAPEYQQAFLAYLQQFFARRLPWSLDLDSSVAGNDPTSSNALFGPCNRTGSLAGYDRSGRLGEITVPTLFLVGRYDGVTPTAARDYQSRLPGSELVVFDSTGHLPMQDFPDRYVAALRDFLTRIERR